MIIPAAERTSCVCMRGLSITLTLLGPVVLTGTNSCTDAVSDAPVRVSPELVGLYAVNGGQCSVCMCVCAELGCLLNPLGSGSPRAAHSARWQPGRRPGRRVPAQLPIERRRYGHNVSDRLAASTAPPFLLLWPEINHKYPPSLAPAL